MIVNKIWEMKTAMKMSVKSEFRLRLNKASEEPY